ncbi:MAG: hypothetical protein AAFV53_42890 [Myxococcota bacterium]
MSEHPSSAHPGTIVFVDETNGTERARPAAEVPDTVAWATVDGEKRAVVRVIAVTAGQQRTLRSYGTDGRLLSSTVQVRRPPR